MVMTNCPGESELATRVDDCSECHGGFSFRKKKRPRHPSGDMTPGGVERHDGEPSGNNNQRMVSTSPRVGEPGVMSQARMTGTNLSVRMRVSATEPSSRSVYSVWSVSPCGYHL